MRISSRPISHKIEALCQEYLTAFGLLFKWFIWLVYLCGLLCCCAACTTIKLHVYSRWVKLVVYHQENESGLYWMDQWMPSGLRISTVYWMITKPWLWPMATEYPCPLNVRSSLSLTILITLHQLLCHATVWCTWAPLGWIGDLFFRWGLRDWSWVKYCRRLPISCCMSCHAMEKIWAMTLPQRTVK